MTDDAPEPGTAGATGAATESPKTTEQTRAATESPGAKRLMLLAVPAILIGVGSAVVLRLLDAVSHGLSRVLWTLLPDVMGISATTWWWTFGVLTLTGAAVGAVVWLVPGHGGFDSAVTELDGPFPKLIALPSLAAVVVLGLAGGVSLGPENPIIAINAALAIAIIGRWMTSVPPAQIAMLTVAATIGALFGTPVAAALIFTGAVGAMKTAGSLWDRLFLPVAAAGAGSITILALGGQSMAFTLPAMGDIQPIYLLTGLAAAAGAAILAIAAAWVLPVLHRLLHALPNPLIFTTLGGAVLGLLAIVGGPLTMFKGLDQTVDLLSHPDAFTPFQLAALAGIRLAALLVAAASGFRGGRIFPIVFVGAALGLLAAAVIPALPVALAVACAVMGVTLVATRDGWIAMFVGVALVGDMRVLAVLCLVILPVWLLVTRAPELTVHGPPQHRSVAPPAQR